MAGKVAADQADRHPDGVWWVDLATVSDSTAVAETIADAVDAPAVGGRLYTLCTHLACWRARLVQPSFALDESNEAAIRSIAAHLDGIPLALELAAAWVRTLSPQQVEAGLDDRFSLLVRGPRGAQRRQRTLAGSIDWSHALLDEIDRIVLEAHALRNGRSGCRKH